MSKVDTYFKQLRISRYVLTGSVLLFVCVIFWTIISIFNSQRSSVISPKLKQYAQPLTPAFNTELLDQLAAKPHYSAQELEAFEIYRILTDPESGTFRIVPLSVSQDDLAAQAAAEANEPSSDAEDTPDNVQTPTPLLRETSPPTNSPVSSPQSSSQPSPAVSPSE